MTYVHDVNANVENKEKYLTDVVQVTMDKITTEEPPGTVIGYRVIAMPAVITDYTDVQVTPVHPKTETVTKRVPVYGVAENVTVQVRVPVADRKQETASGQVMNWTTKEVKANPIVLEDFETEASAMAYYQAVVAHLHEQTDIRTIPVGKIRDSYESLNSRYPGF